MRKPFDYQLFILARAIIVTLIVHKSHAWQGEIANVVWHWPLGDADTQGSSTLLTYDVADTINASWSSSLYFRPFLIVWCMELGGAWQGGNEGLVPSSGWHLIKLNNLTGVYPLYCHLGMKNSTYQSLSDLTANSANFNVTNATDQNPQTFGANSSKEIASLSLKTAATATSATPLTGLATGTVRNSKSSRNLSVGAIAATIVVLFIILCIVLGTLLFCYQKRSRKQKIVEAPAETVIKAQNQFTGELAGQRTELGELGGRQRASGELLADLNFIKEKNGSGEPEKKFMGTATPMLSHSISTSAAVQLDRGLNPTRSRSQPESTTISVLLDHNLNLTRPRSQSVPVTISIRVGRKSQSDLICPHVPIQP